MLRRALWVPGFAALAACTRLPTQPSASPAPVNRNTDDTFTIVDGVEPASLYPGVLQGTGQSAAYALFDGLTAWNDKMELRPALATAWEASPDGTSWTFTLRPGVRFHDGTVCDANAVKASFDYMLDKDTLASRRSSYVAVKRIEAIGDGRVRFVTDPPLPDLPSLVADSTARIVSPAAIQRFGKVFGRNPVGTGPYRFAGWTAGQQISLEAFDGYWGPQPRIRRYVYRPIPEASGRAIALKTGEADVALNVAAADLESIRQTSGLDARSTPSLSAIYGLLRQSGPPFDDARVRHALNHAIDKDAIIQTVMGATARRLASPAIPGLWGAVDFEPLAFDAARARALLAEAGHSGGLKAELRYVSGRWAGDDQVVQAIQGYWSRVGVDLGLTKLQPAELTQHLQAPPDSQPGVLFLLVSTSDYTDFHLFRNYHSGATIRATIGVRTGYGNPAVDRLIDQGRRTVEATARLALLKEAQEIVWKDQPHVYLMHASNNWAQRRDVSGFQVLPSNAVVPGTLMRR
jgi:ABC-type transport system substrate-binding protein